MTCLDISPCDCKLCVSVTLCSATHIPTLRARILKQQFPSESQVPGNVSTFYYPEPALTFPHPIVKSNTSIILTFDIRISLIRTIPKLPSHNIHIWSKFYNCSKSDKVCWLHPGPPPSFMSSSLFVIFQIYELQRLHGKVSTPLNRSD